MLAALGFKALATTSSGFAFTLGRARRRRHARRGRRARARARPRDGLPVSVDLENGYGREPEDAARAIARVAEAGAVGGSIEDYDPGGELYALEHAAERVAAAAEAARALGFPFTLTARAENHIRGNPDLDDTIARLQAYERAGADVLYAPGLRSGDEIRAVVRGDVEAGQRARAPGPHAERDRRRGRHDGSASAAALTWAAVRAMADAAERMRDTATSPASSQAARSPSGSRDARVGRRHQERAVGLDLQPLLRPVRRHDSRAVEVEVACGGGLRSKPRYAGFVVW